MKKIYKVILIFIAVTLLMTSFVACDFDESRNHLSGGDILDREKMSEIKNEIISNMFTETSQSNVAEIEESNNESISSSNEQENENTENEKNEEKVYWTKSGSVWHLKKDCRYLKNTNPSNILSGSVEEAKEAGKGKACSSCGKR